MGKTRKLKYGEHRFNRRIVKKTEKQFKAWKADKTYDRSARRWVKLVEHEAEPEHETESEEQPQVRAMEVSIYGVVKNGHGDYAIFDRSAFIPAGIEPEKLKEILDKFGIFNPFEREVGMIQMDNRITVAGQARMVTEDKIINDVEGWLQRERSMLSFRVDNHGRHSKAIVKANKGSSGVYQKKINDFEDGAT